MSQNTISVSPLPEGTSHDKIKKIFGAFSVKNIHIQGNTAYVQFADQGDLENLDIQFDNYEVADLDNAKIDKTEFDWSTIQKQTGSSPAIKQQSTDNHQDLMAADVDNLIVIENCDPQKLKSLSVEEIKQIFRDFHSVNRVLKRINDIIVELTDSGQMEKLEINFNNLNVSQLGDNSRIQKADNKKISSQEFVNKWSATHQGDILGYNEVKPVSGESFSGEKLGYGSLQEKPTHNVLHEDIIPPFDKKTSMEVNFLNQQSHLGYKEEELHETIPQATTHQQLDYTTEVKIPDGEHKLGYSDEILDETEHKLGYSHEVEEEAQKREEEEKNRKQQEQHQRKLEEQRKKQQEEEQRRRNELEQKQRKELQELRRKRQQQDLRKKKEEQELQRKRQEEERKLREKKEFQTNRLMEEMLQKKREQEAQRKRQEQEQRRKQQEQNRRKQQEKAKQKQQEEKKKKFEQERLSQQLKEKFDVQKQKFKTQTEKIGYQQEQKREIPTEGQIAVEQTEVLKKAEQSIEKQLGYAVNMAKEESAHLLQAGLDLLKSSGKDQGKKLKQAERLGYEKEGPKEIGLNLVHSGLEFLKGSYQKFQQHFGENSSTQSTQKMGYENWSVKPDVNAIKPVSGGQSKVLKTLITVTLLIWVIFLLMQDTSQEVQSTSEIEIPTTTV